MKTFINFFNEITINLKHSYVCSLKWIIFPETNFSENELKIPYDCLCIFALPKNPNNYLLKEIYKVKNRTFSFIYGTWDFNSGLIYNSKPQVVRRFNFNGTELIIQTIGEKDCGPDTKIPRQCATLQVVLDFSNLMNLRSNWIPKSPKGALGDVMHLTMPSTDPRFPEWDRTAPFFTFAMNWYIRTPSTQEEPDYYLKPFTYDVWLSIFGSLLTGVIFGLILYYVNTNQRNRIQLIDLIFMALENICNQDGSSELTTIPYRISNIAFRFFALFIISSYSGTILSYLTVKKLRLPFETLTEFAEQEKYSIGAFNDGYSTYYIRNTNNSLIQSINRKHFVVVEESQFKERFCNEYLAFSYFDNDIYKLEPGCPFYKMKEPIMHTLNEILLNKNSPFARVFTYGFLRYYSSGIKKKMKERVMGEYELTFSNTETFSHVTIEQISQVLSIVPIGIVLATTILFCEMICRVLKTLY